MITLWLNALDHHHRLVIALSSPPIIMHDTTKSRGLYGLNGRLIMNGEWWKVVNDQWHEQVITTYACNTINPSPTNMLHLSIFLFFSSTLCFSHFFFPFLCLWHTQALCAIFISYLGLWPYFFSLFLFVFLGLWPSLFSFLSMWLSAIFYFSQCSILFTRYNNTILIQMQTYAIITHSNIGQGDRKE